VFHDDRKHTWLAWAGDTVAETLDAGLHHAILASYGVPTWPLEFLRWNEKLWLVYPQRRAHLVASPIATLLSTNYMEHAFADVVTHNSTDMLCVVRGRQAYRLPIYEHTSSWPAARFRRNENPLEKDSILYALSPQQFMEQHQDFLHDMVRSRKTRSARYRTWETVLTPTEMAHVRTQETRWAHVETQVKQLGPAENLLALWMIDSFPLSLGQRPHFVNLTQWRGFWLQAVMQERILTAEMQKDMLKFQSSSGRFNTLARAAHRQPHPPAPTHALDRAMERVLVLSEPTRVYRWEHKPLPFTQGEVFHVGNFVSTAYHNGYTMAGKFLLVIELPAGMPCLSVFALGQTETQNDTQRRVTLRNEKASEAEILLPRNCSFEVMYASTEGGDYLTNPWVDELDDYRYPTTFSWVTTEPRNSPPTDWMHVRAMPPVERVQRYPALELCGPYAKEVDHALDVLDRHIKNWPNWTSPHNFMHSLRHAPRWLRRWPNHAPDFPKRWKRRDQLHLALLWHIPPVFWIIFKNIMPNRLHPSVYGTAVHGFTLANQEELQPSSAEDSPPLPWSDNRTFQILSPEAHLDLRELVRTVVSVFDP